MNDKELWKVIHEIDAVSKNCNLLPVALVGTACFLFMKKEIDTPRANTIRQALISEEGFEAVPTYEELSKIDL